MVPAPQRKTKGRGSLARHTEPRASAATPGLLWTVKHRPATLDDVAGQEAAVALLKRVAAGGDPPHLVLYGPRGTGKRSAALALARALFGEGWEGATTLLDLSGEGRAAARDLLARIGREAGTRPVGRPFRLLVLDGCEAVAPWTQQGLRRLMERLSGGSRFLLLTSRLGRLVGPLRSRVLPVPFRSLEEGVLERVVDRVARAEGVRFSDEAQGKAAGDPAGGPGSGRRVLLFHARGSPERALHLLQAAHLASGGRALEAGGVERAARAWEGDLGPLLRAPPAEARRLADRLLAESAAPGEILERFSAHLDASPISEGEKAAWAEALAEAERRLREGLRERTHLQGLVALRGPARPDLATDPSGNKV